MGNLFESEMCSRCGGSGQYSYCQMYGTTCFKCAGRKEVLTKRGAMAQAFLTASMSKRAGDLKVGDVIFVDGYFKKACWEAVIYVGLDKHGGGQIINGVTVPSFVVETASMRNGCGENAIIRVAQSKEEKAAKRAEALAYQATLTKSGSVMKRKAVLA